jgi:hypothetical protein
MFACCYLQVNVRNITQRHGFHSITQRFLETTIFLHVTRRKFKFNQFVDEPRGNLPVDGEIPPGELK